MSTHYLTEAETCRALLAYLVVHEKEPAQRAHVSFEVERRSDGRIMTTVIVTRLEGK